MKLLIFVAVLFLSFSSFAKSNELGSCRLITSGPDVGLFGIPTENGLKRLSLSKAIGRQDCLIEALNNPDAAAKTEEAYKRVKAQDEVRSQLGARCFTNYGHCPTNPSPITSVCFCGQTQGFVGY